MGCPGFSGQGAASVRYRTVAAAAPPGNVPVDPWWYTPATKADFVPASGVITFAPGQTLAKLDVRMINDRTTEGPEYFFVQLSYPSPGWSIDGETMMVDIEANDEFVYQ